MHSEPAAFAPRVAQLLDRLTRIARELQFAGGLNPAQWEALRFLARANKYSRSPSALAEFLGATKGTVSQTLIALEQKGYITRIQSDADKRVTRLELTDQGRALLGDDPIVSLEQAAAELGEDVGPPLVRALSKLLHDLQQRHGLKEFGVCADCTLLCVSGCSEPTAEKHLCAMTGEDLADGELARICVGFRQN